MVSSLAQQLAAGASLNAAQFLNTSKKGSSSTESYLFASREASQHDFDSILALAQNGLAQLTTLIPALGKRSWDLLSDASREYDRTMRSRDDVTKLDRDITLILRLVAPYLLQPPAAKIIEWLVRRFRIQEFNQDDVLACFLPYHESASFAKMVSILHIQPNSKWAFLQPFKNAAKPLPRTVLVTEMCKDLDLARFIVSVLPTGLDTRTSHRSLVALYAGTLAEYINRLKHIDEGVLAFLLPACMRMIATSEDPESKDIVLAGATLLASLSHRCALTSNALQTILPTVVRAHNIIGATRTIQTLVSILSAQPELVEGFPEIGEEIMDIPDVSVVLGGSTAWASEKTLYPLVSWLLNRPTKRAQTRDILSAILSQRTCAASIVHRACSIIVLRMASTPALENDEASDDKQDDVTFKGLDMELLNGIYQRHHNIFQSIITEVQPSLGLHDGERLDQLIMSLSLNKGIPSNRGEGPALLPTDVLMQTMSIDRSVRAIGISKILEHFGSVDSLEHLNDPFEQSKVAAIIDRMSDASEELQVLETVYNTAPETLLRLIFWSPGTVGGSQSVIIDKVAGVLRTPNLARAVVRLHLGFFAERFIPQALAQRQGKLARYTLESLFLPFLLFSKPRQNTAFSVWEILGSIALGLSTSDRPSGDLDLLTGCIPIVKESSAKKSKLSVDEMVAVNASVCAKVAGNILASDHFQYYVEFFVNQCTHTDPHLRLFSLLVIRSLLGCLTGAHQVNAAYSVLQALTSRTSVDDIENAINFEGKRSQDVLGDDTIGHAIVLKPSSTGTTRRLEGCILALIPAISPPIIRLEWLAPEIHPTLDPLPDADTRGPDYIRLSRALYSIVNSTKSLCSFATHLLRSLFITLGDDALLFLAGVWSFPVNGLTPDRFTIDAGVRVASLCHAQAFLAAQMLSAPTTDSVSRDFQVVLPSLLVALQSRDRRVREAVMGCIDAISTICTSLVESKKTDIYAFDAVYGHRSNTLQYLDIPDFTKHVKLLADRATHFATDPEYLCTFHRESLQKVKGEPKKETSRKQRVLCYLLSHVVSWPHLEARVILLHSLVYVKDSARLPIVFPLIESALQTDTASEAYIKAVFAAYDEASVPLLEDASKPYWSVLLAAVRTSIGKNTEVLPIVLHQTKFLSQFLSVSYKVELSAIMLEMIGGLVGSEQVYSQLKAALETQIDGPPVMIPLFAQFQPAIVDVGQRASKKPRLDGPVVDDSDTALQTITCLTEVIASRTLPGSIDLVRTLLETLGRLCQAHAPARSEYDYVEQLLISSLESTVSHIRGPVGAVPLRVDVLVELIRVSDNPQTFQQALLLVGNMTKLSPQSVIHTIMPIFTFMGSHVFHRDDSYSFRVVQQTISNIVPVMVSHLQETRSSSLGLYIDAREFLRIFTDAATHVPRHRRNKFFAHLTETLGPNEFLAPICMLLVDKFSNRVVRQNDQDVLSTLSLPLGVMQQCSPNTQFLALTEVLHECQRLFAKLKSPGEASLLPTFLEMAPDIDREKHASFLPLVLKKQIQALIMFVGLSWSQITDQSAYAITPDMPLNPLNEIISHLLNFSSITSDSTSSLQVQDIEGASWRSLNAGLKVISVQGFIAAIYPMLSVNEAPVKIATLNLLRDRIIHVSHKARNANRNTLVKIIEAISVIIEQNKEIDTTSAALKALASISPSATSPEEGALTKAIPAILASAEQMILLPDALSILRVLTSKLGPRLIPHLRNIILFCVSTLERSLDHAGGAFDVLLNLLNAMPSFWGAELGPVVTQCLAVKARGTLPVQKRVEDIMSALASRVPPQALFVAVVKLWDATIQPISHHDFFGLVDKAISAAPRQEILEHLRDLFKMFLEALDMPSQGPQQIVDQTCLVAFTSLVMKLSEASFTPLFRRLQDWAWASGAPQGISCIRRRTFCRVMVSLLDSFKGLMAPYMVSLLSPITEVLQDYSRGAERDSFLWSELIIMLDKSFAIDDESPLWKDPHLAKLISPLVNQIPVYPGLSAEGRQDVLSTCIANFAATLSREEHIKKLNIDTLMQTRSEDSRVRLYALRTSIQAWTQAGAQLIGFVSDTITFVHECAEDENDEVAREARKLKRVLESVAGPISDD